MLELCFRTLLFWARRGLVLNEDEMWQTPVITLVLADFCMHRRMLAWKVFCLEKAGAISWNMQRCNVNKTPGTKYATSEREMKDKIAAVVMFLCPRHRSGSKAGC